jgi:hypothetical protein
LPYGFYFLISFSVGERDPPFSKEYQEKSTNRRRRTPFFPEKKRGLSFSTLLAPQRTDPENLINRIKKIKKNQNSLGRNPGQLFFVYIKEREGALLVSCSGYTRIQQLSFFFF